ALLAVGVHVALSAPTRKPSTNDVVAEPPAPPAAPASVYRGVVARRVAAPITKASAKRITIGVLAALAFTAAAVPFALHLPAWIEIELVVAAWWAGWSVVLCVIAF